MRRFGVSNENGKTILLVERDDCLRILIREYLEGNGYEVKDSATTAEALRIAGMWGYNRPDMLVTESLPPEPSGISFPAKLRKSHRAGLPVVYLVRDGLDMDTLNDHDFHVQKPFSFLQLHSAIEGAFIAKEKEPYLPQPFPLPNPREMAGALVAELPEA